MGNYFFYCFLSIYSQRKV